MKYLTLTLLLMSYAIHAIEAPTLKLATTGFNVSAGWNNIVNAVGYKLYYAPYPQAQPIANLDMQSQLDMTITLPPSSAFYVAVSAYSQNGKESDYSNIEHFVLKEPTVTNSDSNQQMLIVITAPSVHDEYYAKHLTKIIDFDIQYAKAIMGKDKVIVLVDKDTLPYFKDKLPANVLLEAEVKDIWMRDFSPVHPTKQIKFGYDRPQEASIERSFLDFAADNGLEFTPGSLQVDGGNVVDNNQSRIILTDMVLERNPNLSQSQVVAKLKTELGASEVAIIPMDEEYLGHSDGMVMFIDANTVIMNNYDTDPKFKDEVLSALRTGLPSVKIHEIAGAGYGKQYGDYASACGIYVNSVVTYDYIYMPIFGDSVKDVAAVRKVESLTDKTVVTVDVQNVCFLGGNTRCLSWQLTGSNAQKLIKAAEKH